MKNQKNAKEVSAFAKAATQLDQDFELLAHLGVQLEEADLETEFGLNQAKKLLLHYGECGQRIGDEIQLLAKALEEARIRAEKGASEVAQQALLIQKRHDEKEKLLSRFEALGTMAKELNEGIAKLGGNGNGALHELMPDLTKGMDRLIGESKKIKDEAKASKMKKLEKDAEAFGQMLQSVNKKLQNAVLR